MRSNKPEYQKKLPTETCPTGLFSFMMVFAKVTPNQQKLLRVGILTNPGLMMPGSRSCMPSWGCQTRVLGHSPALSQHLQVLKSSQGRLEAQDPRKWRATLVDFEEASSLLTTWNAENKSRASTFSLIVSGQKNIVRTCWREQLLKITLGEEYHSTSCKEKWCMRKTLNTLILKVV